MTEQWTMLIAAWPVPAALVLGLMVWRGQRRRRKGTGNR
jgi:hypothetical protein